MKSVTIAMRCSTVGAVFAFTITSFGNLSTVARGQTTAELFEQALNQNGNEYFKVRDDFLKNPDREFLGRKLESGNNNEWVMANILLGWMDHENQYRDLINAGTITDRALNEHYPWSRRDLLGKEAAPLLVEILLKGGLHENARYDAVLALTKMVRSGIKLNPKLFTQTFAERDANTRRLLAMVISELPADPDGAFFDEIHELFQSEENTVTKQRLLSGLIRQASTLDDARKKELIDALNSKEEIDRFGKHAIYSTIAELGGKDAEPLVLDYYDEAMAGEDKVQKRDAVEMLFKLGTPDATDRLLNLAQDLESPLHLRKQIHSGFAIAKQNQQIEDYLLNVVKNDDLSADERLEAVQSLNRMDKLRRADQQSSDIQNKLKEILDAGVKDPKVKSSLQDSWNHSLIRGKR